MSRDQPSSTPVAPPATIAAERQVSLSEVERFLGAEQAKVLRDRLAKLDAKPLPPGTLGEVRTVDPETVQRLLTRAVAVAGGLDPARRDRSSTLLWDTGPNRLLVHLDATHVELGDGVIDVTLTVECDETKRTEVVVTFVTATADRPTGFVLAAEDRPRGPAVVVAVWGDALTALAWRAVLELAGSVAATAGRDQFDRPFVAADLAATSRGLRVIPMVPHRLAGP